MFNALYDFNRNYKKDPTNVSRGELFNDPRIAALHQVNVYEPMFHGSRVVKSFQMFNPDPEKRDYEDLKRKVMDRVQQNTFA